MIREMLIMVHVGGIMLWVMAKLSPYMNYLGMDYIGVMLMTIPIIIFLFRLSQTRLARRFEKLPSSSFPIDYIRRDGHVIDLFGKRIYAGESFLDISKLGLVEDLGADTVLTRGNQRFRFALENLNYTPSPKYMNFCHDQYLLGFDNSNEIYGVLNIPDMEDKEERSYYLRIMGDVYQNLMNMSGKSIDRLLGDLKKKPKFFKIFGVKRERKAIMGGVK